MNKKKAMLNPAYSTANIMVGDKLYYNANGITKLGKVRAMSPNGIILFVQNLQPAQGEPLYHAIDRSQIMSWIEQQHTTIGEASHDNIQQ